jgi:hypothetical protein
MTIFSKDALFAWGSTIHRADSDCEVWPAVIQGDTTEILEFTDDCDEDLAVRICESIGADNRFMMLGSMTGEDSDDAPDDEDSEEV